MNLAENICVSIWNYPIETKDFIENYVNILVSFNGIIVVPWVLLLKKVSNFLCIWPINMRYMGGPYGNNTKSITANAFVNLC
jgi:hypothetical protein